MCFCIKSLKYSCEKKMFSNFTKTQSIKFFLKLKRISPVKKWAAIQKKTWWCHQMKTFSGIQRYSPHKDHWHWAKMFSKICVWTNGWANNRDAGDLRCHRTHFDVTVMKRLVCSLKLHFVLEANVQNCSCFITGNAFYKYCKAKTFQCISF